MYIYITIKIVIFRQRPQRGQSPVEHGGFLFVRSFVHLFVSPISPFRPEICPLRPEIHPLRPTRAGFRPERVDFRPEGKFPA